MVIVSKKLLNKEVLIKIYRLFFEITSRSDSSEEFLALMEDILSPAEKIMIAKRIGIIFLLIKNVDYKLIKETLKVSTSTIFKYSLLFNQKETQLIKIIKNLLLKEKMLGFLEDVFADLFIQPGIKIGHYKRAWEHKKRQEEREILA